MFGFPEILHPMDMSLEDKNALYSGISNCHKDHAGVSVAKLMHAVVCFKDMTHGVGCWSWDGTAASGSSISVYTDVSLAQVPLIN